MILSLLLKWPEPLRPGNCGECADRNLPWIVSTQFKLAYSCSYRSRVSDIRPDPEISSLYAFGSAIYLFDKTCHFVPKPGTKHFAPVHVNGCKNFILVKVHTGPRSSRSHVNTPFILVPRGCDPFGQRHGSRPLAGSDPFSSLIGQMRRQ